jgi:hypothetical protein
MTPASLNASKPIRSAFPALTFVLGGDEWPIAHAEV